MEQDRNKDLDLEIEGGRIHFRIRGSRAPRNMPYADCSGVALRLAPVLSGFGLVARYRVALMGRNGDPAILIGDTANLLEAMQLWRRAADRLEKPAVAATPDGPKADRGKSRAGPPPQNIACRDEGGRTHVSIRRGWMEYAFVSALAIGLALILIFGERSDDSVLFLAIAAGLLAYAVIAGLSSRFIEVAGGRLTAGLRTPLGDFAKVEMPLREIEVALWGKAERGWGNFRSAFALASAGKSKSFERLNEDQARWLTRFVREISAKAR